MAKAQTFSKTSPCSRVTQLLSTPTVSAMGQSFIEFGLYRKQYGKEQAGVGKCSSRKIEDSVTSVWGGIT